MAGPAAGNVGEASSSFSVALNPVGSTVTGTVVVNPGDGGLGGTFRPASLALTTASPGATFTYTPSSAGAKPIGITNNGGLANPGAVIYSAVAPIAPLLALGFDAQTPEQISIYCPTLRAVAEGTSVQVRYKPVVSSSWSDAHPLLHIIPSYVTSGAPETVVEAFAGAIFDLAPGTTYDIELTVLEPGRPAAVAAGTRATRALPAPAGPVTVTTTAAANNLQTVVNGLTAGNVLQLANGTYTVDGLTLRNSGTPGSPIVIRGQSRSGVIIKDTTDVVLYVGAGVSHVVVENLTIEGSGVDSGTAALSSGIVFDNTGSKQINVTIRNVTFNGVDKGIKAYSGIDGALVYQCIFKGNNTWDKAYTPNPVNGGAPTWTWNDDGICLPGRGNAAWNNTLSGFGDTFAVFDGVMSAAIYYYRNRVDMTGDDAFEADFATRNIGFYDNYIANSSTFLSLDPLWGGPLYCFRNISINTIRQPFKWTNQNTGHLVYNNTIVRTDGTSPAGLYQANNGEQQNWSFRNNLFVYRGSKSATVEWNFAAQRLDLTHNSWYPDRAFNWPSAGGYFTSLAAAQAGLPSRLTLFASLQRHSNDNIVTANPWTQPIDLGPDHTTTYTARQVPTLAAGSSAKGTGVAIPGITDGFAGAGPDRGAVIGGRAVPQYGADNS